MWFQEVNGFGRAIKLAKNQDAPYGFSTSPAEYLARFEAGNMLFGDDVHLLGVTPKGRFIISQPFIVGDEPTREIIIEEMTRAGWKMGTTWFNWTSPDGRLAIQDAHAGNWIVERATGRLVAIDLVITGNDHMEWTYQNPRFRSKEPLNIEDFMTVEDLKMTGKLPADARMENSSPPTSQDR